MYKIKNYLYLLCLGLFALASACQQDGLSEEELQNLTQSTSLTVNASQAGSQRPVEGATVTVAFAGNVLQAETDEFGQAYFEDVSQGEAIISLSKEGFFDVKQQRNIETFGRLTGDNVTLSLYNEEDAATVKGQVRIQTDLTTEEVEYVEALAVNIFADGNVVATGATDAEGKFEILIPTTENGRFFSIDFPELSRDQQLYMIEDSVPVLKTAFGTIFRPYEQAERLPNTSNIVVEISAPDDFRGGWQAYVNAFKVVDSTITEVTLGDLGHGYRNNPSVIVSANGVNVGSDIELDANFNTSNACSYPQYYQIERNSLNIVDGGSGLPEYQPNLNIATQHPSRYYWDRCTRFDQGFRIRTADIIEVGLDYGTGTITGPIQ